MDTMDSTLRLDRHWTLSAAQALVQALQTPVKPYGFHITLGGSVLNTGSSAKDLDLYFLPLGSAESDPKALKGFLDEIWGKSSPLMRKRRLDSGSRIIQDQNGHIQMVADPSSDYPEQKNTPYAYMRKYFYSGLRVDVFIVGEKVMEKEEEKEEEERENPWESLRRSMAVEPHRIRQPQAVTQASGLGFTTFPAITSTVTTTNGGFNFSTTGGRW